MESKKCTYTIVGPVFQPENIYIVKKKKKHVVKLIAISHWSESKNMI